MTANPTRLVTAALLALLGAHAYGLEPRLTVPAPVLESNGEFGGAVAASADRILVGAEDINVTSSEIGTAYLFDRLSGSLLRSFSNPVTGTKALFGTAVSFFHDDLLITGIPNSFAGSKGVGYLFSQNGNLIRSFPSPTNSSNDAYGLEATTIGDIVVIAAPVDDSQATNSGVVYLFDGTTGQLLRKINNPHPKAEDRFGIAFAKLGTNLVIGSTGGTTGFGAAYVFDPATGNLVREFNNPTPAVGDGFGRALATVGDDLFIGAPGDDTLGTDIGSVYRFNGLTGDLLATLTDPSPDPDRPENFGSTLGVIPGLIAIGAPLRMMPELGFNGFEVGGVFLFDYANNYEALITPTTPERQDRFGMVITGSNTDLILGHPLDTVRGTQWAGSVLIYSVPEPVTLFHSLVLTAVFSTYCRRPQGG